MARFTTASPVSGNEQDDRTFDSPCLFWWPSDSSWAARAAISSRVHAMSGLLSVPDP